MEQPIKEDLFSSILHPKHWLKTLGQAHITVVGVSECQSKTSDSKSQNHLLSPYDKSRDQDYLLLNFLSGTLGKILSPYVNLYWYLAMEPKFSIHITNFLAQKHRRACDVKVIAKVVINQDNFRTYSIIINQVWLNSLR